MQREKPKKPSVFELTIVFSVLSSGPVLAIFLYASPRTAMTFPLLVTLAGVLTLGFILTAGLSIASFLRDRDS